MTLFKIVEYKEALLKEWQGEKNYKIPLNERGKHLFHFTVTEKEARKILEEKLNYIIIENNILYVYRPKSYYYY